MLRRISIVLAQWCPHCVPLSLERAQRMARELNVELRVLDIDEADLEKEADMLVKERRLCGRLPHTASVLRA